MQNLNLYGHTLTIDIADYMQEEFGELFADARWTSEKLIARSPFREDNHPSFYLNLDNDYTGFWGDSGEGTHGNFVQLISALKGISEDEALSELVERFEPKLGKRMDLSIKLPKKKERKTLIRKSQSYSPYLESRGISFETQLLYMTSEDASGFVTFPYMSSSGSVRANKHRSTKTKKFWYDEDGELITDLIFGYQLIALKQPKTVVICEAEIDAMTWNSYKGFVAISLGNASLSQNQVKLLSKINVENVILACDNDKVGRSTNNYLMRNFMHSRTKCYFADYGKHKDANEAFLNDGIVKVKLGKGNENLINLKEF